MIFNLFIKYIFLAFLILCSSKIRSEEPSIIVLMYHRFDEQKYPSTSISKMLFEEQIKYLIKEDVKILPLTELLKYFRGEDNLPKRSVFITIDDAFKSFYKNGFPILQKNNLPFSIFISSDYVSNQKKSDYMSWSMLKELSANNGLILNHSKSHKSLLEIEELQLREEIKENQDMIEKNIGVQPKVFSYPYGESNKKIEDIVKLLGYEIAFSQHSAPTHRNDNKFRLPRYSLNDEFGTLKRLKTILRSKPLQIYENSFDDTIASSSNIKLNFKSIFPSHMINCYINNYALIEKEKNKSNEVKLNLNNLKVGERYRINCTYIDSKGDIFWYGKMIKREG